MEAMLPGFNSWLLQVSHCVTLGNYLYLLYLSFLICGMEGDNKSVNLTGLW